VTTDATKSIEEGRCRIAIQSAEEGTKKKRHKQHHQEATTDDDGGINE
jgi:hypothetical protein